MSETTRRAMIMGPAAASLAACASTPAPFAPDRGDDGDEEIALWPAGPPGGAEVSVQERIEERVHPEGLRDRLAHDVTRPILSVFRAREPNGAALLVIPGGGYWLVAVDVEGMESGRRWSAMGVTTFVLRYRLPSDGWAAGPETSLQDAQRAMRIVRARAGQYGYDPQRIAAMGFSAGGHVAGSLAQRFGEPTYTAVDAADALSARPNLSCLVYPVASMQDWGHVWSRDNLLGKSPTPEQKARYSLETAPPKDTPPTILIHAADDDGVTAENSIAVFKALQAAKIPSALHVFGKGGHGFGLRGARTGEVAAWPALFDAFAASQGLFA